MPQKFQICIKLEKKSDYVVGFKIIFLNVTEKMFRTLHVFHHSIVSSDRKNDYCTELEVSVNEGTNVP